MSRYGWIDQPQLVEIDCSIYLRDRPTLELHGVSTDERGEREPENRVKEKGEMTWDESEISRELFAETNKSHCCMKNIELPTFISPPSPRCPRRFASGFLPNFFRPRSTRESTQPELVTPLGHCGRDILSFLYYLTSWNANKCAISLVHVQFPIAFEQSSTAPAWLLPHQEGHATVCPRPCLELSRLTLSQLGSHRDSSRLTAPSCQRAILLSPFILQ
jgi:hypothetical protein